jgi:hypothetical protein
MKLGAVDAQSQRFSHGPISSAMVPPLSAARTVMPTGVAVPSAGAMTGRIPMMRVSVGTSSGSFGELPIPS